jgi:polysaccharide export outer membrane protein
MKLTGIYSFIILIATAIVFSSCETQHVIVEDSAYPIDSTMLYAQRTGQHIIQVGDKLTISVHDHEEASVGSIYGSALAEESSGKWLVVNNIGTVPIPSLGRVYVRNQTVHQVELLLERMLSDKLVNPLVTVKVLNKRFSVLGEVSRPGYYAVDRDGITLLDAIAMASGTVFPANKKRVRLIRDGKNYVINLTRLKSSEHANLFIRSGDIVIVPARDFAATSKGLGVLLPIASTLSAIAITISVLTR